MPYVTKGKCVYKRDTGKKVGCTKGSVKKYLAALHANVNESDTDPLDWAKDIISGMDQVIKIVDDGKILHPLNTLPEEGILKISGDQDGMVLKNQECKIVRKLSGRQTSEYLMVFPEEMVNTFGEYTHCGDTDQIACHCTDRDDPDIGRCWFVEMEYMMNVDYYPNRLRLMTESENDDPFEWAKKTIESIDTDLRGKAWFIELPGPMEDFEDAQRWAFSQGFSWSYTKTDLLDMSQQSKYANICKLGSVFDGDIKRSSMTFSGSYGKCDDKEINKSIDIAKQHSKEEILIHLKWDSNKKEPVFVDVISLNKKGIKEQEEEFNWVKDILTELPLKFKGKEININISNLTGEERNKLVEIIKPYMYQGSFNTDDIFWSNEDCFVFGAHLKSGIKSIALHCGIEDNNYQPLEGAVCCLANTFEEEKNKENIIPVEGKDILAYASKFINESKDEFDWVEDIDFSKYLKVGQVFEEKLFKRRYFFEITKIDEDNIKVDGFPLDDPEHRKAYNISYDAFLRLSNRGWWVPINPPINESREILTEGKWDSLTRQVVRDIMFSITNNEKAKKFDISLPNDLRENEWEYEKDGVTFSIDLKVYRKPLLSGEKGNEYVVNTAIMDDEDENIIGVNIIVDSKLGSKTYEKIFFKLQEDIRHEIEHLTQVGTPATSNIKTVYGHHKNKFEVPALVHGFYRRAKLEKRPIDEIMIEDLDSEIERGNLTKKEAQKLLTIWIDYSKKNLPAAIYSNE